MSVRYYSKIDLINKYSGNILTKVRNKRGLFDYTETKPYYCKIGDELELIGDNLGEWKVVVIANVKGKKDRFAIKWSDLKIEKDDR